MVTGLALLNKSFISGLVSSGRAVKNLNLSVPA